MIGECLKGVCLFAHLQKTVENGKNRNLLCARPVREGKNISPCISEDFCFKLSEVSNTTLKMVSLRGKI